MRRVRLPTRTQASMRISAPGVTFLLSRRRAILADDMGLGKTRTAIIALREADAAGPYLIICPAAVKLNWRCEIQQVEPDADVHVLQSAADWQPQHRWTVVNYDLLGSSRHRLARNAGPASSSTRRTTSRTNRSAPSTVPTRCRRSVADRAPSPEAVYLLTGTPMSNRPRDLFNLLKRGPPPARAPASTATRSAIARPSTTATAWIPMAPPTWRNWPSSCRACCCAAPRTRRSTCRRKSAPGSPCPIAASRSANWRRAPCDYLDAESGAQRPDLDHVPRAPQPSPPRARPGQDAATIEAIRERLEAEEKVVVFTSYTGGRQTPSPRHSAPPRLDHRRALAQRRQQAAGALQTDPSVRVLVGNMHAAGTGITLTAATHVRLQRPRLGARQPLAGRGPHLSHRPDAPGVRHLPLRRKHAGRLRRRAARSQGTQHRRARDGGRQPRVHHPRRCGGGRAR